MTLLVAIILYGLVLALTLLVWAWLTVELVDWCKGFHRAGMERVRDREVRK